jgi:hypothetical protein
VPTQGVCLPRTPTTVWVCTLWLSIVQLERVCCSVTLKAHCDMCRSLIGAHGEGVCQGRVCRLAHRYACARQLMRCLSVASAINSLHFAAGGFKPLYPCRLCCRKAQCYVCSQSSTIRPCLTGQRCCMLIIHVLVQWGSGCMEPVAQPSPHATKSSYFFYQGGRTLTGWPHTAQSGEPDCRGPELCVRRITHLIMPS